MIFDHSRFRAILNLRRRNEACGKLSRFSCIQLYWLISCWCEDYLIFLQLQTSWIITNWFPWFCLWRIQIFIFEILYALGTMLQNQMVDVLSRFVDGRLSGWLAINQRLQLIWIHAVILIYICAKFRGCIFLFLFSFFQSWFFAADRRSFVFIRVHKWRIEILLLGL